MDASTFAANRPAPGLDVIVVGGGLGGLYSLYQMRRLGLTAHAFEAGSGLGGTWYWNRYPGCRCDIESLEYSYSFSPELEQEWHWPDRYGTQPQILEYIEHVADRFDLRKDVTLNTRVVSAHFDSASQRLDNHHGPRRRDLRSRYVIMATGNLSTPRVPEFAGLAELQGRLVPHGHVAPRGRRLHRPARRASSAPARPASRASRTSPQQAEHLYVFQRTAQYILPARDAPMDPEKERTHKAEYRERRKAAYEHALRHRRPPAAGARAPSTPPPRSATPPTPRSGRAAAASASSSPTTTCWSTRSRTTPRQSSCAQRIRATVKDPRTAELLCPTDHPIGTKRLILDTNYYETFNRDNVTLVDARSAPIERITPSGLRDHRGRATRSTPSSSRPASTR